MSAAFRRDVVCIGVADGGVLPLAGLLAQLPADFPAAVFVVSMGSNAGVYLPKILSRCTAMPVIEAGDDEPISCRLVSVGPPRRQLRLTSTATELAVASVDRPVRPTLDALFVSAATSLGRRVIAVLLGAEQYDAADAANAVHGRGGLVIEPRNAAAQSVSLNHADFVVPIEDMGELLGRLTAVPPTPSGSSARLERDAMARDDLVVGAERVSVVDLLVGVVGAAEPIAQRLGVRLHCVWDRDVSVVLADRRRLRQTLLGLIHHTIERTPAGGAVLLSAEVGAGEVRLCVTDTGPWTTLEQCEHVIACATAPGGARERTRGQVFG